MPSIGLPCQWVDIAYVAIAAVLLSPGGRLRRVVDSLDDAVHVAL
jgi:hypothetical protein